MEKIENQKEKPADRRKQREKTARSSIMYGFIFDNFSKKIIGDPYHERQVERLPPKIYSQRSRIYLFDRQFNQCSTRFGKKPETINSISSND